VGGTSKPVPSAEGSAEVVVSVTYADDDEFLRVADEEAASYAALLERLAK